MYQSIAYSNNLFVPRCHQDSSSSYLDLNRRSVCLVHFSLQPVDAQQETSAHVLIHFGDPRCLDLILVANLIQ